MYSKVKSLGISGIEAFNVTVECDISGGLPRFDVVGLPDTAVKESRERVRSSIKNCKLNFPVSRITVNIAPADIKKEGAIFDLPVFIAILKSSEQIKENIDDYAFLGELSLDGEIRKASGILPMIMAAKEYNADIRVWAPEEENDVDGQNKLIERATEEKPDAILISPSSFTESDQLLKKAKEQGIHIAFIDSYTQEEVQDLTVATDNLEAGQILGRFAKDLVGTDDQIAIVSHVKGVSTAVEREKGFRTGLGSLKDNIVDVVYCDSQYDKSYELTKELMKKYPDLKMIAGMNEYSSVGAARAVKAAKAENRIRVVGVDSSQEAVQLMEHGIFQGIVVQKAFKMGYVGVRETVKMLRGEDYKKNINSGCQLVTPDNMYTSEIEKLLFPFNTLKTYGDLTP